MIITIICPLCGHEQEADDDNDTIMCDRCDYMIDYSEEK